MGTSVRVFRPAGAGPLSRIRQAALAANSETVERKQELMATNPPSGDGHRNGAVRNREQFQAPNGNWVKRDSGTGRFMDQKIDGKPFKGVRRVK